MPTKGDVLRCKAGYSGVTVSGIAAASLDGQLDVTDDPFVRAGSGRDGVGRDGSGQEGAEGDGVTGWGWGDLAVPPRRGRSVVRSAAESQSGGEQR